MKLINKIFKTFTTILKSSWLMAILFVGLALAMAIGTLIENKYNTDTARILVYNSWWFELTMAVFVLNFLASINRYKLLSVSRIPILGIHLSLVIIIIGAFITRYTGYEGLISIREGEINDEMLIDKTYLRVEIENVTKKNKRQIIEKPLLLSQITEKHNYFNIVSEFETETVEIEYKDFIENAKQSFKEDTNGNTILKIVDVEDGRRHEHYIKDGEVAVFHEVVYTFNNPVSNGFNFYNQGQVLFFHSPFDGTAFTMTENEQTTIQQNSTDTLKLKALYTFNRNQFVIPDYPKEGNIKLVSNGSSKKNRIYDDALMLNIKTANKSYEVSILGNNQKVGKPEIRIIGDKKYSFSYGSKIKKLPFKIKLLDFIAYKYPGTTNSYSGFESKVLVNDITGDFESRIYMNNVLDHKGYRFFQASFHPDEKGTILSINNDRIGTYTTYLGYFLLYISMLIILFSKKSRFGQIIKQLKKLSNTSTKIGLVVFILFQSGLSFGQSNNVSPFKVTEKLNSVILNYEVSVEHAEKFGALIIQDEDGRMKPINTFSSEVIRKISKADTYHNLNSDQVFISMLQLPEVWYNVPLIYVKKDNDSIRKLLGVKSHDKNIPLSSFFGPDGNYLIKKQVEDSYKSIIPNQFDKDFIEVDKRVNLLYNTLGGFNFKIFPLPNEENEKWITFVGDLTSNITNKDSLFIKQIVPLYFENLNKSIKNKDYTNSDYILAKIENFQIKYGSNVRPEKNQITLEVLYNKYDVFKTLFIWYLLSALITLIVSILSLFNQNRYLKKISTLFSVLIYCCFIVHTFGLIARWYISGHAPWSDAYESIIYISWATMFFGLLLSKKSGLALSASAFVVSMILMVAHWNWLDPSIANLQPVLNSYWLMIHVAIIVASYGPFTLGMVIGFLSLILMIFLNKKNHERLKLDIKRLLLITELSLTIGLVMLTIGNFLGGQWANESWGRYWAWDPKETWALISILLYAFIIHMRLVPKLKGKWLFALMSVLGFYSILMTYFGVNFYLSGLHSYAKGDNIVTPNFIYYSLGVILMISFISYKKQKTFRI